VAALTVANDAEQMRRLEIIGRCREDLRADLLGVGQSPLLMEGRRQVEQSELLLHLIQT